MRNEENRLRSLTLALTLAIMGFLGVASLGAVIEEPLLAYFWYLALFGLMAMAMLSLVVAVNRFASLLVRRYRALLLHWHDGMAPH
jgi:hypothetical protein